MSLCLCRIVPSLNVKIFDFVSRFALVSGFCHISIHVSDNITSRAQTLATNSKFDLREIK